MYSDLVERAKKYAREILAPRALSYDQERKFPRENFEELHQERFTYLTLPESLGGRDLYRDPESYSMVLFELSKGCTNTAVLFHNHSFALHVLSLLGTEEQAVRYARAAQEGKIFASYNSENYADSHGRTVINAYARGDGDSFAINGRKDFCFMAGEADFYVLWCESDKEEERKNNLHMLVTPANARGIHMVKEWNGFALQGTSSHSLIFENLSVIQKNVISEVNSPIQQDFLYKFDLGISAVFLGAGAGAFDWILDYAKKRLLQPDNIPIARYPSISRQTGKMKIVLDGALLMVRRAAWLMSTQSFETAYGAINDANYVAIETASMITEKAVKIAGGPGLMRDFPLQRFHRDARAGFTMPPSSEERLELAGITSLKGEACALTP